MCVCVCVCFRGLCSFHGLRYIQALSRTVEFRLGTAGVYPLAELPVNEELRPVEEGEWGARFLPESGLRAGQESLTSVEPTWMVEPSSGVPAAQKGPALLDPAASAAEVAAEPTTERPVERTAELA